jgi:hypothetical protein
VTDIAEQLLAAIAEREKAAREAQPGPWHIGNAVDPTEPCNIHTFPAARGVADNLGWLDAEHIIWHDPTSILRLCQAHREIVETFQRIQSVYLQHWAMSTAPPLEPSDHLAARMSYMSVVVKIASAYGIESHEGAQ